MNEIERAHERFLRAYLRRLDRRSRREARRFLRNPIRVLGSCLFCEFPSKTSIPPPGWGVYVPQEGSRVDQFVIYMFCETHANDPRRLDGRAIEQAVARECERRPHDFIALPVHA